MLFTCTLIGFTALSAVLCLALPRLSPASFAEQKQEYKRNHTTLGCRITHMFGIPMIFLSLPMITLGWQWFAGFFVGGWILQLLGHFVFEGNMPVLVSRPKNRFTIVYAVIFVVEEWIALFTGRLLRK